MIVREQQLRAGHPAKKQQDDRALPLIRQALAESLKFVLELGCVDAVIVGFEKPEEVVDYRKRLRKALGDD